MKCPHCSKEIFGISGLQEIQKFMKHLPKCKKSPNYRKPVSMEEALRQRDESGQ